MPTLEPRQSPRSLHRTARTHRRGARRRARRCSPHSAPAHHATTAPGLLSAPRRPRSARRRALLTCLRIGRRRHRVSDRIGSTKPPAAVGPRRVASLESAQPPVVRDPSARRRESGDRLSPPMIRTRRTRPPDSEGRSEVWLRPVVLIGSVAGEWAPWGDGFVLCLGEELEWSASGTPKPQAHSHAGLCKRALVRRRQALRLCLNVRGGFLSGDPPVR